MLDIIEYLTSPYLYFLVSCTAGASLFEGMNLAASAFDSAEQTSSCHRDPPQPHAGDSDVLFTKLNLGSTPDTAKGTDIPVAKADTAAPVSVSAPIQGVSRCA